MATIYQGFILWKGDLGSPTSNEVLSYAGEFDGWMSTETLAASLNSHTLCNKAWIKDIRWKDETPAAPGVDADISKKAILYFRDPDTLKVHHFMYPSPIAADLEDVGYGKRVKQSVVVQLVGFLSIYAGKSFVPLYGVYVQRI